MIIDGKKIAAELRKQLKKKVAKLKSTYNAAPGLTVILIGEDPPSKIYVKNKDEGAEFTIILKDAGYGKQINKLATIPKVVQQGPALPNFSCWSE